jgi:hypothetical protein
MSPVNAATPLWSVESQSQTQAKLNIETTNQNNLSSQIQALRSQGDFVTLNRAPLSILSVGDIVVIPVSNQSYLATFVKAEIHPNGSKTLYASIKDDNEFLPVMITIGDNSFYIRAVTPSGTYVASGEKNQGRLLQESVLNQVIETEQDDFFRPQDTEEFKQQQIKKQIDLQMRKNSSSKDSGQLQKTIENKDIDNANRDSTVGPVKTLFPVAVQTTTDTTIAEIDALIYYTPDVVSLYSGDPLTRIYHLVAVTNQIYVDSNVYIHLNAVAIEWVNYTDTVYSGTALGDITFQKKTVFENIPNRRYELGGDIVILLRPYINGDSACGIAWANGSSGSVKNTKDYMYSHISIDCGDYVMAHELGHNMGLTHSRRQDYNGSTFPFALGYGVDGEFTTVMAYQGVFGAGKIYKFSNPTLDCNGYPCGIDKSDSTNGADAVYALNAVRTEIEHFYKPDPDITLFEDAKNQLADSNLKTCLSNANVSNLTYAAELEWLYCGYGWVSDLTGLDAFSGLTNVSLPNNSLTSLNGIAGLKNLSILEVDNNNIDNLSDIESLSKLESLNVNYNNVEDISILGDLQSLSRFRMNNNKIVDISVLEKLEKLTYIDVESNNITDISALSHSSLLTDLYISHNQISLIPQNIDMPNLIRFYANSNNITDVSSLANLQSLSSISFDFNDVPDITPIFKIQETINYLSIYGNNNIPCWQINYAQSRFSSTWLPYTCNADTEDEDYDGDGVTNALEVAYGLDPSNSLDADEDNDSDGLSNKVEISLGTDINNEDSDGDGVIDGIEITSGSDPLNPLIQVGDVGTMMIVNDINNDNINDWITYKSAGNTINVSLVNGRDFNDLAHFSINNTFERPLVAVLDDRDADGINEIGVFGFDASLNRYQLQVYSGLTGIKQDVWNWPATLGEVKFQALTDLTGDGIQEYAISGVHLVNGTRQLVVKDGVSKSTYQTFKWPNLWDKPQFITMSDVTFDNVPEVALYGRHSRLDKGQLFVYDGANANSKVDVYNWNKLWSGIQLVEMDDIDGDGTIDWGQFGQRKDDGRYQWVVKKGSDKRGVIRTFSWPNDLVDVTPMLVADRTGDGIHEVAVLGTSPDSGKVFLRLNDGRLANQRIANISWPASWEDIQVAELGDLNNDGFSEFGLLGFTKSNRTVQLIVRDGLTTAEYGRYTLSGQWEGLSLAHYDIDNDGSDDVVISGINQTTRAKVLTGLSGRDLAVIVNQSLN